MIVSLVERGWHAARVCSLDAQRQGVCVIHLIKGTVSADVLALVAPRPHIHLISVARMWFWPAAWLLVSGLYASGRLRAVLVDNDRSLARAAGWLRGTRVLLTTVQDAPEGYALAVNQQPVSSAGWYAALAAR